MNSDMEKAREIAHQLWSIHPREIQDMGTTREKFYAQEIAAAIKAEREACVGLVLEYEKIIRSKDEDSYITTLRRAICTNLERRLRARGGE